MQDFKYVSDICRYVRVFLLQWRKAAKARRKVREGSEYHYLYEVAHENMIIIPCPDSAGRQRVPKARRKGSSFGEP